MSLFGPRGRSARPTRSRKMPLVGPSDSAVTSKKVEEKGSTMTDFKVGDKVTWELAREFGRGEVLGFQDGHYRGLRADVRFEDYGAYDDEDMEDPYGVDFHSPLVSDLKLVRTLAEKRADDFRVLEEASRPWRNAPDYYKFPHDVQTTDISMHLNSNGGQAVGYISRSTRIDGQNKEDDPRESLRKAIDLIQMEIYRLDEKFGDTK